MAFVVIASLALLMLAAISVQMSFSHAVTQTVQEAEFRAAQLADSAVAHAVVRIRHSGLVAPHSGSGTSPSWVTCADGRYYYYTDYDATAGTSVVRAWGKVAVEPSPSTSTDAPDATGYDGYGWQQYGLEVIVQGERYVPTAPMYMGNGGIEKPLGGFEWASGVDPADPSTWQKVTSGATSYQTSTVPFQLSALDHPIDYLTTGTAPSSALGYPHPYQLWTSQNPIGQFNVNAWFTNSAGSGFDPTTGLTPAPTSSYYDMSDGASPDNAYPIATSIPDVQDFASELWNKYKSDTNAAKLTSGAQSGTYGTVSTPKVTFVTGSLRVDAGQSFKGTGILVIRDDYDPNTSTTNTPSVRAGLDIRGKFEWTGLVIIAGWAPDVLVSSDAGASGTIVGSLFGEDSVQSGGETSLDSATIIMQIQNPFRVLYSNGLFRSGGLVHDFLPLVTKKIVGIRPI